MALAAILRDPDQRLTLERQEEKREGSGLMNEREEMVGVKH